MFFKSVFSTLFFVLVMISSFTRTTSASVMSGEELLLNLLLAQKNITQFRMEVSTKVYDPEAEVPLSEKITDIADLLHELPDQAFTQEIVWVREEFLGVETRSVQQVPYHLLIRAENQEFSKNLTEEKHFTTEDVLPCLIPLFTKFKPVLASRLNEIGIETTAVEYITKDYKVFYKMGKGKSYLLIDPEKYRITEIHKEISIDGRDYELAIKFSEWHKRFENLPLQFDYTIEGRVFKTVHVDKIQSYGLGRIKHKFLRRHKSILPDHNQYSAEINYAQ